MSNIEHESFSRFFDNWIAQQQQYLGDLISISREHRRNGSTQALNEKMTALIAQVILRHEIYYREKSRWARDHIKFMFSPSWASSLEGALFWIGGPRPTMAIHVLYSRWGVLLDDGLDAILRALDNGNLGDMSRSQVLRMDALHRETVREETLISEALEASQERLIVELGCMVQEDRLDVILKAKEQDLVRILQMADDLRLSTLKRVVEILTPIQAVYFLMDSAGGQVRVHELGTRIDVDSNRAGSRGWSR